MDSIVCRNFILAPKLDTHRFDCAWKQAGHHILRLCIPIG